MRALVVRMLDSVLEAEDRRHGKHHFGRQQGVLSLRTYEEVGERGHLIGLAPSGRDDVAGC